MGDCPQSGCCRGDYPCPPDKFEHRCSFGSDRCKVNFGVTVPCPEFGCCRKPIKPKPATPMNLTLISEEDDQGVIFCRVDEKKGSWDGVTVGATGVSVVKSHLDCDGKDTGYGKGRAKTLCIPVNKSTPVVLQYQPSATSIGGACWYQSLQANKNNSLISQGPQFQGAAEFTIKPDRQGVVSFDITYVEGVSGGLSMSYEDDGQVTGQIRKTTVQAAPERPDASKYPSLKREPTNFGFMTLKSDKNRGKADCAKCNYTWPYGKDGKGQAGCPDDGCLAGCPPSIANDPCGQHACRVYYAYLYAHGASYCSWLKDQKAQAYCWAMDEWVCNTTSCGYGGPNQPKNCQALPEFKSNVWGKEGKAAWSNSYSCGHTAKYQYPTTPTNGSGEHWWENATTQGCEDKTVDGQPTNPQPLRSGGTFTITFIKLDWLHTPQVSFLHD